MFLGSLGSVVSGSLVVLSRGWYSVSKSPILFTGISPILPVDASAPSMLLRLKKVSGLVDLMGLGSVIRIA